MYDPMTLVLTIRIPFTGRKNERGAWEKYPETLLQIWHVDPETDGTDDSCDWTGWKISRELADRLEKEGRQEWKFYFSQELGAPLRYASDLEIIWAVWSAVDWRFGKRRRYRSTKDINHIFDLTANPSDNLGRSIQEAKRSPEGMGYLFYIVYRNYKRWSRPWWKHPRLHFWHYKIRIVPLQVFKRWAFSRCSGCGRGFRWGESVTTTQWGSSGPSWFQSERNIYHSDCIPKSLRVAEVSE